jgi:carbonic anhydrase
MKKTCSDRFPTDPKKNVPRNISSSTATLCENKCWLWYNFAAVSSCYVTNEGSHLTIKYDGGGDVTFNTESFTPSNIRIFSPSLHMFNGKQMPAEIIVEHLGTSPSMDGLLVCIPVNTDGGNLTTGGTIIEKIINESPLEQGSSEALKIADFTLNNIFPKAPYFTYTGPLPYDECAPNSKYQYVVFDPAYKGNLSISKETLIFLRKQIHFSFIVATAGNDVFYNSSGTSSNAFGGDGQIYIQCQPTGTAVDDEVVYREETGKKDSAINLSWVFSVLVIIASCIVMVIIIKVVQFVSTLLDSSDSSPSPKKDSS